MGAEAPATRPERQPFSVVDELKQFAYDLLWTWQPRIEALFRALDPDLVIVISNAHCDDFVVRCVPALLDASGHQIGPNAHPAGTSHSIAANARNNLVFVPLPANNAVLSPSDPTKDCRTGCVAVFWHPDEDKDK